MEIIYDENYFIIDGPRNAKITIHFKLGQFELRGKVFIQRELVAGLQELRELYGGSLKIHGLSPRGSLGANKPGFFAFD